jgi:short-subunit dehydrogenase
MSDPFPYARAHALVTGGSSGIGRAIAHALKDRGVARLTVLARRCDALNAAARELGADAITQDLAAHDAAERVMDRLAAPVDLLVNAAGLGGAGRFGQEDGGSPPLMVLDVNARALTALTLAVLPGMRARGFGGILNVASTAGQLPVPYSAAYGATKAYVLSLTRALWAEEADGPIRVAGIVPGVTRTNLGGEGQGEVRGALEKVKVAEPEEVAAAALDALDANDPARIHGTHNALLSAGLDLLPEASKARVIAAFKS